MGFVLLLVQIELADVVQGLACHASHSVHPHFCNQHTLHNHQASPLAARAASTIEPCPKQQPGSGS